MRTAADIEAEALACINRTREHFSQPTLRAMPQGLPCEEGDCPIQRALRDLGLGENLTVIRDRVGGVSPRLVKHLAEAWDNPGRRHVRESLESGEVPLPKVLRRFVWAFDREKLLHLQLEDITAPNDIAAAQEQILAGVS